MLLIHPRSASPSRACINRLIDLISLCYLFLQRPVSIASPTTASQSRFIKSKWWQSFEPPPPPPRPTNYKLQEGLLYYVEQSGSTRGPRSYTSPYSEMHRTGECLHFGNRRSPFSLVSSPSSVYLRVEIHPICLSYIH
jgi:hypothetical protein